MICCYTLYFKQVFIILVVIYFIGGRKIYKCCGQFVLLNQEFTICHYACIYMYKDCSTTERLCLSGSGGLQEESFLSRGSLISPTQCFGFKVQKHVMFKRLQLCCLKVNSGHRAVGQHEGFLLCLQPSWAPCCGVNTPSCVHCRHSWKCRSRRGYCLIPGPSVAPRLEPLGGGPGGVGGWGGPHPAAFEPSTQWLAPPTARAFPATQRNATLGENWTVR